MDVISTLVLSFTYQELLMLGTRHIKYCILIFKKNKYLQRRLLEMWWPFTRDLIKIIKTSVDSIAPPAIAPNIIPANAPLFTVVSDDGLSNTAKKKKGT